MKNDTSLTRRAFLRLAAGGSLAMAVGDHALFLVLHVRTLQGSEALQRRENLPGQGMNQ